jgi:excinuclease ABC subunit A
LNDSPTPMRGGHNAEPSLRLTNASRHNLKDLTVEIPLARFVCITGVSGSGKTTLAREVLLPALTAKLQFENPETKASDRLPTEQNGEDDRSDSALRIPHSALLEGWEHLGRVIFVDQSILAKTPRSNPAVYIGAFDDIREFFAQSEVAKQRGLNASAFSFNSSQGQCERCRGAGFEKIEMQFLSDVFIRCPDCHGRRYRKHILEVKISPKSAREEWRATGDGKAKRRSAGVSGLFAARHTPPVTRHFSIADLLDATIEEALDFLGSFPESRPAQRAAESLKLLQEVGLGYLKLGQPINTLSGGESQRLKLVRHLAEATVGDEVRRLISSRTTPSLQSAAQDPQPAASFRKSQSLLTSSPTLFLFDEPTTGLHFDDVRVLLKVFQRLVDAGHSVLVIEHNLDVIKSADWIIDLGPEAGDQGGQIVAEGTPEDVAACPGSHTAAALRGALTTDAQMPKPPRTKEHSS